MKTLALILALALGHAGLAAAEAPSEAAAPAPAGAATAPEPAKAPAVAEPTAPASAEPTAPSAPSVPGGDEALGAPEGVSTTGAQDLSASAATEMVLPEEVEDPLKMASEAPITDLKPVSSTVLAKLANSLDKDQSELFYDAEGDEVLKEGAPGAWRVDTTALYAELARRLAFDEDKDARQALNLAELRRDERAAEARQLAFEDKLAEATIAQLEAGKPKAKAELERLAGKGNRRARQYLGMDKLPVAEPQTAPAAVTEAAKP